MNSSNKIRLPVVFLFYLALAVLMTWPMAINLHKTPLFDKLDISATYYNFWWQYYSMFDLHASPWFNPLINWPEGYSMVLFPLYFTYGIFSYPVQALFGSPDSVHGFFNWISILSFAFTGLLGFLVFCEITGNSWAGIVVGALFSFLPFHYWHLPRCHTSCLELVLLPIYFYFALLRNRSLKSGIFFGLALVPVLYQAPNYVIYLTMFFSLNILYLAVADRRQLDRKWLTALAAGVALAAIIASPYLYEIGKELLRKTMPVMSALEEQGRYSANLLGFVLPGKGELVYRGLGAWAENEIGRAGVSGKEFFPGYLLLLTGLLGIFAARKHIRDWGFWLLALGVFFILSLGPSLNLAGHSYPGVHLPYYYLRKVIPFFEIDRSPVRIAIMALLALAVFSAGFFKMVSEKISGSKINFVMAAALVLGMVELNQAPIKVESIPLPELYQRIASEPGQFTLFELPFLPDLYRIRGFYQPYHKKHLAQAMTARQVAVGLEQDPMYFYFNDPQRLLTLEPAAQRTEAEKIRTELKRRQVKYVIVYLKFVGEEQKRDLDRLAAFLDPARTFNSGGLFRVYQFGGN